MTDKTREHPQDEQGTATGGQPPPEDSSSAEQAAEQPPDTIPQHLEANAEQAAQLQSDLAELQNRALRAQAELDNFRKRVYRQMEEERKYAAMALLQDLLPVMDNLQRAIAAAEQQGESGNGLLQGVRIVFQQLNTVLEKHHCTAIDAKGKLFDPHVHEAIAQFPSENASAGVIVEDTQTGYLLHDRVVRPSRVVVSSGPPTPPDGNGSGGAGPAADVETG